MLAPGNDIPADAHRIRLSGVSLLPGVISKYRQRVRNARGIKECVCLMA